MRVHVNIHQDGIAIDKHLSGKDAVEIVKQMKAEFAAQAGLPVRLMVNAMPETTFVQEIVKKFNEAKRANLALPKTCEEFLEIAKEQGYIIVDEA